MAPTTSRLIEQPRARLAEIARRVEQRRKQLGLTQQQLAERCTLARRECFASEQLTGVPRVSRERIAKIIMAKGAAPGRSAAKALYPHELKLLAHALDVPIEWLGGPDPERPIVVWDALTEARRAEHVMHLFRCDEQPAAERLSWAEFLPPSFTTPEFMHAHHTAVFLGAEAAHDAAKVVRLYDAIGNASRHQTLFSAQARSQTFTYCMFRSHLSNIARGECEYRSLSSELRHTALQHVAALIAGNHLYLRLLVVEDRACPELKRQLRGCDSLFVTGNTLTMWRDHFGNLLWSEHPRIVTAKRRLLEALHGAARYRESDDVVRLLRRLMGSIRRDPTQRTRRSRTPKRQANARR